MRTSTTVLCPLPFPSHSLPLFNVRAIMVKIQILPENRLNGQWMRTESRLRLGRSRPLSTFAHVVEVSLRVLKGPLSQPGWFEGLERIFYCSSCE